MKSKKYSHLEYLIGFFAMVATSTGVHAEIVDVYILAGQSNAAGRALIANVEMDPGGYGSAAADLSNTSVKLWHSSTLAGGPSPNTWTTLAPAPQSAPTTNFGPEIGLGNRLLELSPARNIAIIKHARGATSLHTDWDENNAGTNEWDILVSTVQAAMQSLINQGDIPIVRGMAWQQGERDALSSQTTLEQAEAYGQNLRNLITAARSVFNAPNMTFAYGRVLQKSNATYEQQVRDGQDAVDQDSGHLLATERAFLVPSDDLTTDYNNDDIHLDYIGQLELGSRFANQFVCNGEGNWPIGDLNFDSIIDVDDWSILIANAETDLSAFTVEQAYQHGDLDADGAISVLDFTIFKHAYNAANPSVSFEAMIAGIPEPGALTLACLATLTYCISQRRDRIPDERWSPSLFDSS